MRQEEKMMIKPYLPKILHMEIYQSSNKSAFNLINKDYWGKRNKTLKISIIARIETEFYKHLKRALRVANVSFYLAGVGIVSDVVGIGRDVVLCHFIESELPKLLVLNCVLDMLK